MSKPLSFTRAARAAVVVYALGIQASLARLDKPHFILPAAPRDKLDTTGRAKRDYTSYFDHYRGYLRGGRMRHPHANENARRLRQWAAAGFAGQPSILPAGTTNIRAAEGNSAC